MSNCIICGVYPGINSSVRIDTINNDLPDLNGVVVTSTFVYTLFPGNVCSYCDINIRDSNKNLIYYNAQNNGWTN